MYQNDAHSEVIKGFVREYQAHGVVDVVNCHTYATLTNRIKEASREAGANYMSLETDYSKQGRRANSNAPRSVYRTALSWVALNFEIKSFVNLTIQRKERLHEI